MFGIKGWVALVLVAALSLAGGSVWGAHDCCGHPSDSSRATDAGSDPSSPGDDCVCTCCQAETAISPLSGVTFQYDSWWSVESIAVFAVSRFETDIFRPPLA